MAKLPNASRGVLLNCTDDEITELYVIRAKVDHGWDILLGNSILELGTADQISIEIEKLLRSSLAPTVLAEERALSKAKAMTKMKRRIGEPAVFCINVPPDFDYKSAIAALRTTAPECGLIPRIARGSPPVEWPEGEICHLKPILDDATLEQLDGLYGNLQRVCEQEAATF